MNLPMMNPTKPPKKRKPETIMAASELIVAAIPQPGTETSIITADAIFTLRASSFPLVSRLIVLAFLNHLQSQP